MTIPMMCENCNGRWVALIQGATIKGEKVSYHFSSEALRCPRCEAQGVADSDTLLQHQQHPETVATTLSEVISSS